MLYVFGSCSLIYMKRGIKSTLYFGSHKPFLMEETACQFYCHLWEKGNRIVHTPCLYFCYFPAEQAEGKVGRLWLKVLYLVLSCLAVVSWRPALFWKGNKGEWIWGRGEVARGLEGVNEWGKLLLGCILQEKGIFQIKKIHHSEKRKSQCI